MAGAAKADGAANSHEAIRMSGDIQKRIDGGLEGAGRLSISHSPAGDATEFDLPGEAYNALFHQLTMILRMTECP